MSIFRQFRDQVKTLLFGNPDKGKIKRHGQRILRCESLEERRLLSVAPLRCPPDVTENETVCIAPWPESQAHKPADHSVCEHAETDEFDYLPKIGGPDEAIRRDTNSPDWDLAPVDYSLLRNGGIDSSTIIRYSSDCGCLPPGCNQPPCCCLPLDCIPEISSSSISVLPGSIPEDTENSDSEGATFVITANSNRECHNAVACRSERSLDYGLSCTITPSGNVLRSLYSGDWTIVIFTGTSFTLTIEAGNDSKRITEEDKLTIITSTAQLNDGCTEYVPLEDGNSASVKFIDNDDWQITGSGGGSVEERAVDVDLPLKTFDIRRSGSEDRSYGITVEFTVASATGIPGADFYLTWNSSPSDPEKVVSLRSLSDGLWAGSVYFPGKSKTDPVVPEDDLITLYVVPVNNARKENDKEVTITVTDAYANMLFPFTASGSGTVTIKNDDNWKVSVVASDDEATERMDDVDQDYGEFIFTRSGGQDKTYGIPVTFEMFGDATYGSDYTLQFQNENGQWIGLESSSSGNGFSRFTVEIPRNKDEVKVRLLASLDWEDEGEKFDPFGGGTPKDDEGEWAKLRIVNASWPGMGNDWNPIGDSPEAEVEIKDGAFCSITSDVDNNGEINKADYDKRHDVVGSLVLQGYDEKAHYYAWVEMVGNHAFNMNFAGGGGITYVPGADTLMLCNANNGLATGYVDARGATNSPDVVSGCLSLSVGGGSDWTRFSVFSVTVDMAFNHDRGYNDGGDGLNIRTNGDVGTEHHAPEYSQNNPDIGETWTWDAPSGNINNKTVLYTKGQSVKVYNRFKISLALPYEITVKLKASSIKTNNNLDNISIVGLDETEVTFAMDRYSVGVAVAGVTGFVEFDALSNTSLAIAKEEGKFEWTLTQIEDKTAGTGKAIETDPITVYTVLSKPTAPWDTSDSALVLDVNGQPIPDPTKPGQNITTPDNKNQPWVTALEFTIATAGTKGYDSDSAALTRLTTFLHAQDDKTTPDVVEGHGLKYDTENGDVKYFSIKYSDPATRTGFLGYSFATASYMSHSNGSTVNCFDQGAAVTIFGRLLGVGVNLAISNPFGYINMTNLVGNIVTDNPFYNSPDADISRDLIFGTTSTPSTIYPLIESSSVSGVPLRSSFGRHVYAILGSSVYDACAGPITGMDLLNYFGAVIDFNANRQYNLKNGRKILPENANEVSSSTLSITYLS